MKLQHELKRPIPFASLQQEALLNLLRAGDQLDNRLSRLFREHGLTLSRFNVLRSLIVAERPLTCGEIGERMIQLVPAITSLVDHLEQNGMVQRHRSSEDRRVVHVQITKHGREVADALKDPLVELEKSLLKKLNRSELKSLIELLEKTRESLTESED
ncbi:MarR family transcriptional regulator [Rubripirellula amarantea]|uniref:HTH-type transcriptional regulator MhqR n=1 Tax=Rubripirellula amarantea TaxID=2527999 RepID=A0A5C5WFU7_9BACT|nr:MarR family transcriptional regulator [Rubripirellula amarantea]MDA8743882.1 MarR family transcriptional regulator [Rubripirellula amarantea]TWT49628.1 HTH-type transcriptional regulator MhqR [Rubripirellula amarantea]